MDAKHQRWSLRMLRTYKHVKSIGAGTLLAATMASSAAAQPNGAGYVQDWHPGSRRERSWEYCAQLIRIFDKYTASRSESSDGGRNQFPLAAEREWHQGAC